MPPPTPPSILATKTPPEWIEVALNDLDAVYSDHLHCERKAAQSALSIVRNYPGRQDIVVEVTRLAHEETSHVIQVTQLLSKQGKPLRYDLGDEYARQLRGHIRKTEPERLLDILLVFALIEARSAERLSLLANAIPDSETASLYQGLANAETRHRDVFLKLAQNTVPAHVYRQRLQTLVQAESTIVAALPIQARIH